MDWKKVEERVNFMDRLAGDKVVWIIVLFLCLISMVAIFSSTSQLATETTTRIDIVRTQFFTILGGLALIFILYKINNIKVFKWLSQWGFLLSLAMLLILDLHLSLGPLKASSINGAWRIIKVGGLQIHVLEIVKVAMVMYLAWAVDTFRKGEFNLLDKLSEINRLHFLGTDAAKKIIYIYAPVLIICVTVFAIYCILHDAFLSISGNAKSYLVIFSLVVFVEGFVAVRDAVNGNLLENGQLTFGGGAPALMFVCFLAILITLIVRTIRTGKEAEE